MKLSFLKRFLEFNRGDKSEQLNLWGYDSSSVIDSIVKDKEIKQPVELTIYKGNALLTNGNHRIVAAEEIGLEDIPCKVIIKGSLKGELLERFKTKSKKYDTNKGNY